MPRTSQSKEVGYQEALRNLKQSVNHIEAFQKRYSDSMTAKDRKLFETAQRGLTPLVDYVGSNGRAMEQKYKEQSRSSGAPGTKTAAKRTRKRAARKRAAAPAT